MSFLENNLPTSTDNTNNLLRKILNVLLGGLSTGGATEIMDPTDNSIKAQVSTSTPANDAAGLVVRVVGASTGTSDVNLDQVGGDPVDIGTGNVGAGTQRITIASNCIVNVDNESITAIGFVDDAAVTNPVSNASVIAALKGLLSLTGTTNSLLTTGNSSLSGILSNTGGIVTIAARTPNLGQALMAASSPVVIASDQSAVPVTFSNTTISATQGTSPWVISNANLDVALSTLALKNQFPTSLGATTKAGSNSVAIATDTYGQATKANSLPVTIASDQGNLSITPGTGTLTDRSGTITSGAVSQQLAASNTSRKYLLIVNCSTETLWVNFTSDAVQGQPSFPILPNGSFVMEGSYVSTEKVTIIGATTGSAFSAKEG